MSRVSLPPRVVGAFERDNDRRVSAPLVARLDQCPASQHGDQQERPEGEGVI